MDDARLLLEGVPRDEVTAEFLVAVMEVAEEHGLDVEGVSVRRSSE